MNSFKESSFWSTELAGLSIEREIEMGKRTSEIQNDFFNYLSPLYLLDHQVTEISLCIIGRLTKFKQSKVLQHSESDHQIF